jgi:hypothetical protein
VNQRWLFMAKRWAQNPPSAGRVKFIAAIIVVCIGLYTVETLWSWPAWLTPSKMRP